MMQQIMCSFSSLVSILNMEAMKIVLFLFVHLTLVRCIDPPTIDLEGLGTLIGSVLQSRGNRSIHAFQGVPYAESPSGNLRFQPPVRKYWNGTFEANKPGIICPQPDFENLRRFKRSSRWDDSQSNLFVEDIEDCLLISVYKPSEITEESLPVMVFVHGGSFIEGSASRFTPEFLLDRDVVLVVPQYRLGPFGFLSMQNDIIPGNAGLLDVIESLKWVRDHIKSFGGNPNKVTLFGQSAGAAISTLLMLSPLSEGLMGAVIANSGAAIATWTIDSDPVRHATQIAFLAGCRNETIDLQGECLQGLSVNKLFQAFYINTYLEYKLHGIAQGGSLPVVSRIDEPEATKVIPTHPADMISKGNYPHLPLLMGANRHDAMFMVNLVHDTFLEPQNLTENEEYIRHKFPQYIVENCGFPDTSQVLTDMMKEKYFKFVYSDDRGNFSKILPGVLDFYTTSMFKAPGYSTVQLNSVSSNASFWYSFNYKGRFHIPENGIDPGGLFSEGVTHSDEMIYLTPRLNVSFNEEELKISHMMVNMWANFAVTRNPSFPVIPDIPVWPSYNQNSEHYLDINVQPIVKRNYPAEYTAAIDDVRINSSSCTSVGKLTVVLLVTTLSIMLNNLFLITS